MTIITNQFRTRNASDFKDSFADSNYYIFASSKNIAPKLNSEFSANEFLETTLFGKKIDPDEVFFVIDNTRWWLGTVYEQYDDKVDLSNKKYYVIVYPSDNTTGDYRVFKCLFNNYGQPSIDAPNYNSFTDDQIYRMTDGYIWKYMYAISTIEFQKYTSLSYAPIIGTSSANTVLERSIDHIEVENNEFNKGYELVEGAIDRVNTAQNRVIVKSDDLNMLRGYYTGQNLYVISPDNDGRLYVIDNYAYNTSLKTAIITLLDNTEFDFIQANFTFKIFPRIEITGDGSGAIAIPSINPLGSIEKVEVLNKGSGYTRAIARVVKPVFGFNSEDEIAADVEASLRPILSPSGGHATNFADELNSRRILVYTTLSDTENLSIPSSNDYTNLGIVKNPEFTSNTDLFDNRLKLELSSDILTVNETVTQVNNTTVTFSAEVHAVDGSTAYLCNYHGPYPNYGLANSGFDDISIQTSRPIISSQNQVLVINNITRPPYIQKTGDVYYMTFFAPITRTSSSNEEYKIILEF